MTRLLRCFLLDQNTPILHHTETNCPHSFSITVDSIFSPGESWSTQTLKCKQGSSGGVRETTYQYVRSYADNTCSIYKTEATEGHDAIYQDHSDGQDCDWTPLCYKKGSSPSSGKN